MVKVMEKPSEQVPAMRFAGFKGPWKSEAFGELAEFTKGKGISKQDISEEGQLPCIRYAELYTVYGEVIDEVVSRTALEADDLELSQAGDVIIPASGETAEDIARAACVKNAGVALGGDLNIIRSSLDGTFLAYHLNGVQRLAIASLAQGKSVVHLYPHQLRMLDIRFPTLPEQQKIAAFLGAVDRKIQQLKRKQELLERYKKGVVQQLFSQELRFKLSEAKSRNAGREDGGEFPEWEEKRLGDICSNVAYGMNASAVEFDGVNKYLRITDIDENSREFLQTGLTSPGNELEDKYLLREGDLLFARTGASVGKSYLYKKADGKVYFAGFLIRFRIEQGVPEFIYAQTRTKEYERWVTENSMRSGQPGLNAEEYKSFVVKFPSLEEQSRIAGFLMALDAKVAGVAQAVAACQKWKKGLLQQLFV